MLLAARERATALAAKAEAERLRAEAEALLPERRIAAFIQDRAGAISSCGVNTMWLVPSRQACLKRKVSRPSDISCRRSLAIDGRAR